MEYEDTFTDNAFQPDIDNDEAWEAEQAEQYQDYKRCAELSVLKEFVAQHPARPYISLIARNGEDKGEINHLTDKQYRILTGARWRSFTSIFNGKKVTRRVLLGGEYAGSGAKDKHGKTCWEYTLDQLGDRLGVEDSVAARESIYECKRAMDRIKELQRKC